MEPFELTEALTNTDVNDRTALNSVARTLGDDSRESIEEAVRLWASGDEAMARKAAYVLGLLGDAAIGPLLDATAIYSPLQQVWRIRHMVNEQVHRRNEIVAELESLLGDKTEVPYPIEPVPIEEPPPDERVCDVAYILLRIILNPQADPEEHDLDVRFFRDLEFEERDTEIEKYLSNGI